MPPGNVDYELVVVKYGKISDIKIKIFILKKVKYFRKK